MPGVLEWHARCFRSGMRGVLGWHARCFRVACAVF